MGVGISSRVLAVAAARFCTTINSRVPELLVVLLGLILAAGLVLPAVGLY